MTTVELDGMEIEVVDPEPPRALVVVQPEPVGLAAAIGPEGMIALATRMATALRDIVDRQKLYATINGKKYPQVEAWMTIARMDNVVAREVESPIRHDDGSYEATIELIRLSDGLVIGRASALCGTPDDKPWNTRSEPARRSMAVTRATSRGFRQQYSWIMALAGYEPTPAEEMPRDGRGQAPQHDDSHEANGLVGTVAVQGTQDMELRTGPDGAALPFRVREGRQSVIVVAHGALAEDLAAMRPDIIGQRVMVWGSFEDGTFEKAGRTVTYRFLTLARITGDGWELPEPARPPVTAPDDFADLPGFEA